MEFQGWIKLELDDDVVDIDDLEDDVLEVLDCFNYELFPNAAYVASTVKNAMVSSMIFYFEDEDVIWPVLHSKNTYVFGAFDHVKSPCAPKSNATTF